MKKIVLLILLLVSAVFLGCAGEKLLKTPKQTPAQTLQTPATPASSAVPAETDSELQEAINDTQEIESLMNELQQLENLDFQI